MRPAFSPLTKFAMLLVLSMSGFSAWAQPHGMAVNSRGNEIDSQRVDALWRINLASGQAEYVGWTGFFDLEGLALVDSDTLLGTDDDTKTIVRVSQVSGLAIPVGGQTNRSNMGVSLSDNLDFGMAMDCSGEAWVVSSAQQSLFKADLATGELIQVGATGSLGAPISDLAIRDDQVFGIGVGLNASAEPVAPNLYSIDLDTAEAVLIGPLGSQALPYFNAGLDFDGEGNLWAVTDRRAVPGGDFPSAILRIDPETGLAELVAETIVGLESLAISPPTNCTDRGTPGAVNVPVFSSAGLLLMLMLMPGLAWLQLRRT